ncbi:MAG TPA: 4Fe-4S binding protein [Devosia sp.]|nr:4Fe-4S binding protein [Devosia sp.]
MLFAFTATLITLLALALPAMAAGRIGEFLPGALPGEFFIGADNFGEPQGEPPMVPVYRASELAGYVYLNSDFTRSTGYSGKPIHILVGIDTEGIVRGLKLVAHNEPIVLIGIPVERVIASVNGLIGKDIGRVATGLDPAPQVDIVSGATVTVLVMADSVVRSAVRLIRSNRLDGTASTVAAPTAAESRELDTSLIGVHDWESLIGDGSVRTLALSVGEVSDAFTQAGQTEAAPETDDPDERFIELYVAPVSVPSIGLSLLGETGYERLQKKLEPGQQAIVVAADGLYSFKGSGYVRGGIFDRIELLQDGEGVRFRDRNHTRLGDLAAEGAPALKEIALFVVPTDFALDITAPWELQLLVQRAVGTHDKTTLPFGLDYILPTQYLLPAPEPAPEPAAASAAQAAAPPALAVDDALWLKLWQMNLHGIIATATMLLVLTVIFFFQDWLVRRPKLFKWVRYGFLTVTLVWLGWIANAQLSVVNIFTFLNALITDFSWEFFLSAPLVFILWAAVAVGLLFWGRGPFCGWLCPFGALQELSNAVAQWLKVPQIKVPFWLHERLWPIKYIIFLALFGLSLYSLGLAEVFAEVEPFKTAIVLKFVRDWPFVLFALTVLSAGLFIERFYCRYLCPLGAALAIPGRIRMFEWLKRWNECGSPCQRCAKECPVQAIHPEGQINVNECIYCMHCQELYNDDQRCPHMIQVRLKRDKFVALSSPATRGQGPAKTIITHNGKSIKRPSSAGEPNVT